MILLNDLSRLIALHADDLENACQRVLRSGWVLLGAETKAFEQEWAGFCGVRHSVTCANGTDALELMLRALNIGRGDEVVTAANAGGYATTAILRCGATPVYTEVDAQTLCMHATSLPAVISAQTRAVIATHLYGQLADMESLEQVCQSRGVPLLEDGAQAHGATRHGKTAGSFGAMASFSFYPTKNLGAMGDAGAVVTDDAELAGRLRELRQYGWSERYVSGQWGINSRMDEMQAAILRVFLPRLKERNARRRQIRQLYRDALPGREHLFPGSGGADHVAHLCVLRVTERTAVQELLQRMGVQTSVHYPLPDYLQPAARRQGFLRNGNFGVTEQACASVLTVPCYPEMNDEEVRQVAAALVQADL